MSDSCFIKSMIDKVQISCTFHLKPYPWHLKLFFDENFDNVFIKPFVQRPLPEFSCKATLHKQLILTPQSYLDSLIMNCSGSSLKLTDKTDPYELFVSGSFVIAIVIVIIVSVVEVVCNENKFPFISLTVSRLSLLSYLWFSK